ncbi:hypothetical protein [Gemmatimonas sp.]|jgi:hypothetical protein|uniref:hypothetical protein n=1 Tax=Gemmatimonas sp. TaxID=1962908 RepID=UPI0022C2C946|nr:hypothetical protein [Gemmatimonas sp.]MCA2985457.1 hypothetical protein [Gemmatimonas sp.]MCA2986573.1 hypothetical protein [Gemmatimonas sp.]MCA2990506.1 hypothetical protein [Gemmatimonas sp.]MCA2993898.1 hypothetical protein [Gemmatimonas sp.]MCE2954733.1 hypothetical protein [Gemmatimonas sp.]
MSNTDVRVFVNERGVSVPAGTVALDAVRALFPDDADGLASGRLRLTDSRGLPIAADTPVVGGAIFRVVTARERLSDGTP